MPQNAQLAKAAPYRLGGQESARPSPAAPATPQLQWATIVRVLVTCLLLWAVYELWALVITCAFSLLLAVTAEPLVDWLERRGLARGFAVLLLGACLLAAILLTVIFIAPPLSDQIQGLLHNLTGLSKSAVSKVRPVSPFLAGVLDEVFQLPHSPQVEAWLKRPLIWGEVAMEALVAGIFAFTLTLYLLYHGKRTYAWLLAYVPRGRRAKMAETLPEVSVVVLAYMRAQIITTLLFALFSFTILTLFHVPAALALALLAGFCDVIPLVGIVIATTPAVLLAFTVSHVTAGAVLMLYLLYAAFEGYVLVPKLYGHHLRLSPLVVLIALAIGGRLQGIAGALLILPLVAAYPIVERIWLSDYLGDDVLDDHSALEQASETEATAVVEAVLQGVAPSEETPAAVPQVAAET
jgi:predicted PurR-regulated permease PerM